MCAGKCVLCPQGKVANIAKNKQKGRWLLGRRTASESQSAVHFDFFFLSPYLAFSCWLTNHGYNISTTSFAPLSPHLYTYFETFKTHTHLHAWAYIYIRKTDSREGKEKSMLLWTRGAKQERVGEMSVGVHTYIPSFPLLYPQESWMLGILSNCDKLSLSSNLSITCMHSWVKTYIYIYMHLDNHTEDLSVLAQLLYHWETSQWEWCLGE